MANIGGYQGMEGKYSRNGGDPYEYSCGKQNFYRESFQQLSCVFILNFGGEKVIHMALFITLFGYISIISYLNGGSLMKKNPIRRTVQGKYTKFGRHMC